MYNAFSRREIAVNLLRVRAGTPAAAADPLDYAARVAREIDSPMGGMYAVLTLGRNVRPVRVAHVAHGRLPVSTRSHRTGRGRRACPSSDR